MGKILKLTAELIAVGGIINFLAFFAVTMWLGGDAQNGHEANGHFYVANHGYLTEVSEAAWQWSLFQARSVCITMPLAVLAMGYLSFQYKFPATMYGGRDSAAVARVQQITQGEAPLASVQCAGKVGQMNFTGPLLQATLYPAGLVLKGIMMPSCAISRAAITQVLYRDEFWVRGIEIQHTDPQVGNPILLGTEKNSEFWRCLHAMVTPGAVFPTPPWPATLAQSASEVSESKSPARPWVGGTPDSRRYGTTLPPDPKSE